MPALQEAPPKSCPKCRGSMIVERDWHGTYGSCIMCGYVHEVLTSPPVDLAAEEAALPQRQPTVPWQASALSRKQRKASHEPPITGASLFPEIGCSL